MRRTPALAALALVVLAAAPASAHVPARVRIAQPAEDARVVGGSVRVVLVGDGGSSAASFSLRLDGQPLDASGRVGGVFRTMSVRPDEQTSVTVPVRPGRHELVLLPDRDSDSTSPVQTRTFRVVAAESSGGAGPALAFAGLAVVVAVGAAVAVRRRAAAAPSA